MDSLMSFEEALDSVNLSPDRVDIVIQTHLHFDHCYNTRKCVNAKVFVQKSELEFALNPVSFEGIYRKELFEGLDLQVIKGDYTLSDWGYLLDKGAVQHSASAEEIKSDTDIQRKYLAV